MAGITQLDFLNYSMAFKGNYKKGADRLRAILQTPTQANAFAANAGGVSVIFGVPEDAPDENSDELLNVINNSPYAERAVETWLHCFYDYTSLDELLGDEKRCADIKQNPVLIRAISIHGPAIAKWAATMLGLDCKLYKSAAEFLRGNNSVLQTESIAEEIIRNSECLSVMLKDETMRGDLATLNTTKKYEKVDAAVKKKKYFKQSEWWAEVPNLKGSYWYNGTYVTSSNVPNESIFLTYKAGSTQVGGYGSISVYNLQDGRNTGGGDKSVGGGQYIHDKVTGGFKIEAVCVGGMKAESHQANSYVAGYAYYAI